MTHVLLAARLKLIEDAIANGADRAALVRRAVFDLDAVAEFSSGTHFFSLCGVRGTATMGHAAALDSWCRLARKRLEAESGRADA